MTNDKWQEIFHRLTTSHRKMTVDEIKEATAEMNDGEIAKLKSAVKMQRTHLCLDNPDSPERRETFDYYNLIMRVVTNERIQPYKAPDMIMSGEVYLVPVSWVDDRTMEAEANGNIDRWIKNGMVGDQHLAVALATTAEALHLFEPQSLNRRTAHVTTASFIRLMESKQ